MLLPLFLNTAENINGQSLGNNNECFNHSHRALSLTKQRTKIVWKVKNKKKSCSIILFQGKCKSCFPQQTCWQITGNNFLAQTLLQVLLEGFFLSGL